MLFAHAGLREGFLAPQLKLAVVPEHRLLRRRRGTRPEGPRTGALASFTDLRAGARRGARGPRRRPLHRLRDQDRRRRHARLPRARVPRRRPRVRAERPAAQDQPLRRGRRGRSAAVRSAASSGSSRSCARSARRRGARRRADHPLRRAQAAAGHPFPHDSEWQMEFEGAFATAQTPTSWRRSRRCAPTWRRRARWTG